jgi:hypothetical protein
MGDGLSYKREISHRQKLTDDRNMTKPPIVCKSIGKHQLTYTLLSESDLTAARAFGLAWRVNDETLTRMKGYGIDLETATGCKHHMLPVPAAYVIIGVTQLSVDCRQNDDCFTLKICSTA